MPELYTAATRDEMDRLLLARVALFVDTLGYDPENVTVLAPTRGDVARIGQLLARAGAPSRTSTTRRSPSARPARCASPPCTPARVSTSPWCCCTCPACPSQGDYDEAAGDTLARNLIYVAMTRAMDNLSVFTMAAPAEKPLADLVRLCAASA